jgi:CRISPR-associated endonuclease Cas1
MAPTQSSKGQITVENATATASPRNGILLLGGYGIRVAVNRGHLTVEDGVGTHRRAARFPRATRDLRRLVVLGHSGTISFDALQWITDIGAAFVHIGSDGRVLTAAGPTGLRDSKLRRNQAQAVENGLGLTIAKELVHQKLTGQRAVLDRLPENSDAKSAIDRAIDQVAEATTIERLRATEAEGALAYWGAWAGVRIQFARRDAARIPKHWKAFGHRASLVTGNSRKATNPANAILNYLYAIAEAEAKIAALAVGCDPGLGIMHADQGARDSLALDLMEPVRPQVDGFVLDLLESRAFRKKDFFETRKGVCRVMPPLTRLLAETAPRWTAAAAPIAERLARQLLGKGTAKKAAGQRQLVPTPLTQSNRSKGREAVRKRAARSSRSKKAKIAKSCVVCGADLPGRQRRYCTDCRSTRSLDAVAKAHAVLRARRLAGSDPAHGGNAAKLRGKRNSVKLLANSEWDRNQTEEADTAIFEKEIRPKLKTVSLLETMRATGLSRTYCGMIRRGVRVPHPRHWGALRELVRLAEK